MAGIKIRFYVDSALPGIPLSDLAGFSTAALRVLKSLIQTVVPLKEADWWRAMNFANSSFGADAAWEGSPSSAVVSAFVERVEHNLSFDPDFAQLDETYDVGVISSLPEFARHIDERDTLRIGVLENDGTPKKWHAFNRKRMDSISNVVYKYIERKVEGGIIPITENEYIGGFQGIIRSLILDPTNDEPHFWLRDLPTETQIKCFFDDKAYEDVVEGIRSRNSIIHVSGIVRDIDPKGGKFTVCQVHKIHIAESLSDEEFNRFFKMVKD